MHATRQLNGFDRVLFGAVTYTSLARTVCDLADPADVAQTLTNVDNAIALGAKQRWVHQCACRLSARGRRGIGIVRDATAPEAAAVFRSWLERAAGAVYEASCLPPPQWNVALRDHTGGFIGLVDALWRPWHVVSEKEGLRFHTAPSQRQADAERFNRLREAGYDPRRFTWSDIVTRPDYVAATVAKALQAAGADIDLARIPRAFPIPALPFGG